MTVFFFSASIKSKQTQNPKDVGLSNVKKSELHPLLTKAVQCGQCDSDQGYVTWSMWFWPRLCDVLSVILTKAVWFGQCDADLGCAMWSEWFWPWLCDLVNVMLTQAVWCAQCDSDPKGTIIISSGQEKPLQSSLRFCSSQMFCLSVVGNGFPWELMGINASSNSTAQASCAVRVAVSFAGIRWGISLTCGALSGISKTHFSLVSIKLSGGASFHWNNTAMWWNQIKQKKMHLMYTQAQKQFRTPEHKRWNLSKLLPQNIYWHKPYSLVYLHSTHSQFHAHSTKYGGCVRSLTCVKKEEVLLTLVLRINSGIIKLMPRREKPWNSLTCNCLTVFSISLQSADSLPSTQTAGKCPIHP